MSAQFSYEKQADVSPDPLPPHTTNRTYVVSEPDPTDSHYAVPAGAYPTSAPYVNFSHTEPPSQDGQGSSTSSDRHAHTVTTAAADQHKGGVGESAAVRFKEAPGEMGTRGGGYGGQQVVDREGTTKGTGHLADRNPPPDGPAAEMFSKAGVDGAWKLRK